MQTPHLLVAVATALASLMATSVQAQTAIYPSVNPINITVPGAYKLMGNISVAVGKVGLTVTVDNVTIDLNGHTITGSTRRCEQTQSAFEQTCTLVFTANENIPGIAGRDNLVVRNGSVQGFGIGVQFTGGGRAESLTLRHNQVGLSQRLAYPTTVSGMGGLQVSEVTAEFNQWGMQLSSAMVDRALVKSNQYGITAINGAFPVLVRNSFIVGSEVGLQFGIVDPSTRFTGNLYPTRSTVSF